MDTFVCGWVGGAAGVLVSHPLDTLRVLLQTKSVSYSNAANSLLRAEGVVGFWKGMLSPLVAVGLWKAVMFSANSRALSALKADGDASLQPVWHSFVGGVAAGAAGLSIQSPFERIKIMAQTLPPPAGSSVIAHEIDIARQVWRYEGMGGLYRGTLVNVLGCPLAIGVWFGVNEALVRRLRERRPVGLFDEFACGGVAGTLAWAVNFPTDKAKAIVQAEAALRPGASDLELLRPHLRAQGLGFLWRGIGATLVRALPQTGATIVAFTEASKLVKRSQEG